MKIGARHTHISLAAINFNEAEEKTVAVLTTKTEEKKVSKPRQLLRADFFNLIYFDGN